ncbi:oligosaccharide flippase family protein [Rhizobium sullae]|uniref:O-antigen/teichoic acid export membrane protein n=1 Tax=Rhizobium sullae TaxID=50338 RepID=A0A4R3PWK1_RHISU|nr:oligosaccharide flippase family protein [Rhizobium sullae]TCU06826.1 O-antigen/teichoic acid export membrane protein [Rhizobium sullae]
MIERKDVQNRQDTKWPPRAVVWTGFNALSQIGTRFAAMAALSWLLPPSDFGQFNIAFSIAIILATVAQLGIPTNLICLDGIDDKSLAAAALLAAVSSVIVAGAYLASVWMLFSESGVSISQVLYLFAPYVVLQVFINLLEALSRRTFAFKALAFCELTATVVGNLVLAIVLAYQGWGVLSLVAGQFASASLQCIGLLYICRDFVGLRTNASELRRLASAGFSITIAEAANIATVHVQRPLVGIQLGAAAAGLWGRFYQIISIQLTCLVQPMDKLLLPALTRRWSDVAKTREIMLLAIEAVSLLTIPISIITAFASAFVIPIAFGPAWNGLILPMQIASITFFFRGVDRILLSSARATGHMRSRAVAQLVQLAMVLVAIPMAAYFGLTAVAAAYVGVQVLSLVMMIALFCSGTKTPFRHVVVRMVPGFILGAASLALGLMLMTAADALITWGAVAATMLSAVTCVFVAVAVRYLPLSPSMREIVRKSIAGVDRSYRLSRRSS